MAALLLLPAELRLQIYTHAIPQAYPNAIDIDEGATSTELPRSTTALSLMQIDAQLRDEMLPLYWSHNTFVAYRLTGMGHYISTDRCFYRWMREIVKGWVGWVRYLRFKGAMHSFSWEMQLHEADCIMTVDVDINHGSVCISSKRDEICTCSHAKALQARMQTVLARTPRLEGRLRLTAEALWNIFESWYIYHPIQPKTARSWEEFQLHYGAHGA